ncbi:MAG TPA: arginyltransferase [Thermohalobaculum sp.]|nr:arginyltransferase [Thermohalobaculum sp.]
MSHHESVLKAQFYLTAPQPCAYLEGREERKVFTTLSGTNATAVNNQLSLRGFRRSQSVIYRPACVGCAACMSIRIPVAVFEPGRTQRRIMRRNADVTRQPRDAWATETQYALFRRYLDHRHAEGGMADMDAFDYAAMVDETPVTSTVVEYSRTDPASGEAELIAACLSDILGDGLSMVYSFYDPETSQRSLGSYMILDHIRLAREMALPFVYLGYWVAGSPKMNYKIDFRPFELCDGARWRRFRSQQEFRRWRGRAVLETRANALP